MAHQKCGCTCSTSVLQLSESYLPYWYSRRRLHRPSDYQLRGNQAGTGYTSVKDTVVRIEDAIKTELTSAKEAEREPSLIPLLSQIRALKANIGPFALDPEFVEDDDAGDVSNYEAKFQFELFPKGRERVRCT